MKSEMELISYNSNNQLICAIEELLNLENHLFLYAPSKYGKTLLLRDIISKNNGSIYITAESLTNDIISSIHKKAGLDREKYRCGLLIVDNIEYLIEKTSTIEEIKNIFSYLVEHKTRILISSSNYELSKDFGYKIIELKKPYVKEIPGVLIFKSNGGLYEQ